MLDFLKDFKAWVSTSKNWLHGIAKKIRYTADIVDWFANTLDSLPIYEEPKEDNRKDITSGGSES